MEKLKKRGQTAVEYLIIFGFVTFAVLAILTLAYFYSSMIRDRLILNQVETFANKVIYSAESVFYSGEPSKATINARLPNGITNIAIIENSLIFSVSLSSGTSTISFSSHVPISGTLPTSPGLKRISLVAEPEQVVISSV